MQAPCSWVQGAHVCATAVSLVILALFHFVLLGATLSTASELLLAGSGDHRAVLSLQPQ